LFGFVGEKGSAGGAEFATGPLAEFLELLGCAAVGVGITTGTAGALNFSAPGDINEEGTLINELLGSSAAAITSFLTVI
jgi:hypothetical protein